MKKIHKIEKVLGDTEKRLSKEVKNPWKGIAIMFFIAFIILCFSIMKAGGDYKARVSNIEREWLEVRDFVATEKKNLERMRTEIIMAEKTLEVKKWWKHLW